MYDYDNCIQDSSNHSNQTTNEMEPDLHDDKKIKKASEASIDDGQLLW
jgi:hypothetical protein